MCVQIAVAVTVGLVESSKFPSSESAAHMTVWFVGVFFVPIVAVFADTIFNVKVGPSRVIIVATVPHTIQGFWIPVGPLQTTTHVD